MARMFVSWQAQWSPNATATHYSYCLEQVVLSPVPSAGSFVQRDALLVLGSHPRPDATNAYGHERRHVTEPTRPLPHAESSPSHEGWQHDLTWKILTTISLWIDRVRRHVWDSRLRLVSRPLAKIAHRIDIQLT